MLAKTTKNQAMKANWFY